MAARALCILAYDNAANQAAIAEAGGIPLLVELLRDGSADAKLWAAAALGNLVQNNTIRVMVAAAGGIPPLVDLLRDTKSGGGKLVIARVLRNLAHINHANLVAIASDNHANAVAIAVAAGLEALVALARRGRVTVENELIVSLPAKRKAALVVAALLRGRVPVDARSRADVRDVIRGVIGPYL
jgi:vacuolar protein 8